MNIVNDYLLALKRAVSNADGARLFAATQRALHRRAWRIACGGSGVSLRSQSSQTQLQPQQ